MDIAARVKQIEQERNEAAQVVARCDKQLAEIQRILGRETTKTRATGGAPSVDTMIGRAIAQMTGPMRLTDIAALVGRTPEQFSRQVADAVLRGHLVKVSRGVYAPVEQRQELPVSAVEPADELVSVQ